MSLSKRLSEIYTFVDNGSNLADIGADHGQLVIELAKNNKCNKIFCNDNKVGPFNILKNAIEGNEFSNVTVSLSDGISKLPDYIDAIVIAGMGGDLIIDILSKHKEKLNNVETLILAPNTNEKELRKCVCDLGYKILDEKIIFERHYYEIIKFVKGNVIYNELDYEFGPILRKEKNAIFQKKYQETLTKLYNLINKELPKEKKDEISKKIERINQL
ncbi:MAG: SAM-dependent methyltransferase [Erysipelotrichales bacterium]|nr:SAM-dependent methyltransferase [Erysipelotrichales bacterium]